VGRDPHPASGINMSQVDTKIKVNTGLTEPPMYRIIYMNDDRTPAEFVMTTLIEFFSYTAEQAEKITWDIHEAGSATVAVLPYELAEQKGVEVTVMARKEGHPLQIKLEPDVV
jgi:ATP-dependent Clp protease adaptor protein ClpS